MKQIAEKFLADAGQEVASHLVKKFQKLTETHVEFLAALVGHGYWATERCGWFWGSQYYSLKTSQSLAKKGFLATTEYEKDVCGKQTHYKFTPIDMLPKLKESEVKIFFTELGKLI